MYQLKTYKMMKTMKKVLFAGIVFILFFANCRKEEVLPEAIANFTVSKVSALVNETLSFTNLSENALAYKWDFGDGKVSEVANPSHVYLNAGTFIVKLTATGESGSTHEAKKTISISYPEPTAKFSMSKDKAETGEEISFTNESENAGTYLWDFGDETSSSEKNPSHTYSDAGNYTVTLTATGDGGTHSVSKQIEITTPPFNIVPGERIGDFVLGENLKTLFSFIDEAYFSHFSILRNNGKYLHLAEFEDTGIGFFLETSSSTLRNTDVPHAIYAFNPFEGNTEKGITFGSTLEQVKKIYGTPDEITSSGSYSYVNSLGIAFWSDDSKTLVEEIYISHSSDKKSLIIRNLDEKDILDSADNKWERLMKQLK